MPRFVKGITLTPEERHKAGLLPASNASGSTATATGIVKTHTCMVRMPDGSDSTVQYERFSPHYHVFTFAAPISQSVTLPQRLAGGIPAIEGKAAELAEQAFRQAQAEEQKRMRRKTPLMDLKRQSSQAPQMDAKIATRCAGRYAVCVKHASGRLLRIGPTYERPEGAQNELCSTVLAESTNGQTRIIGICNRLERRWVEAKFLALLLAPLPEPCSADISPGDEELPEEDETDEADIEEIRDAQRE